MFIIQNKTAFLTADCLQFFFFFRVIKTIHIKKCNKTAHLKDTELKF